MGSGPGRADGLVKGLHKSWLAPDWFWGSRMRAGGLGSSQEGLLPENVGVWVVVQPTQDGPEVETRGPLRAGAVAQWRGRNWGRLSQALLTQNDTGGLLGPHSGQSPHRLASSGPGSGEGQW